MSSISASAPVAGQPAVAWFDTLEVVQQRYRERLRALWGGDGDLSPAVAYRKAGPDPKRRLEASRAAGIAPARIVNRLPQD